MTNKKILEFKESIEKDELRSLGDFSLTKSLTFQQLRRMDYLFEKHYRGLN